MFSEMKSRKRNQKKEESDAKVYEDYDWADRIRSGSLVKLAVKGLDKYTDHHHLQRKYLSKEDKIQCKTHHYYSTTVVQSNNQRTQRTQLTKMTKKKVRMVRILF